ncbi:MAG TPA: DUF805 domain-containing protein [Erysipelotrichaceae bacterium]|nr:DUF805 domain-containing protein [Erysipelotrichaceae bacterium]
MEQKYCSNCGTELRVGSVYCSNCGINVEQPIYTKNRSPKGIFDYYKDALSKYAVFSGRASLYEYWYYFLGNMIISFVGTIVLGIICVLLYVMTQNTVIPIIIYLLVLGCYFLYIIIPSLSIAIRRLHDQNKSGAWYLIILIPYLGAIIIFIFMCLRGTPGYNQYGNPSE